jgi:hypothetical protein
MIRAASDAAPWPPIPLQTLPSASWRVDAGDGCVVGSAAGSALEEIFCACRNPFNRFCILMLLATDSLLAQSKSLFPGQEASCFPLPRIWSAPGMGSPDS